MSFLNLYLYLLSTKTAVSNKQIMVIWFHGTARGTLSTLFLGVGFLRLLVLSCETLQVGKETRSHRALNIFSLWRNVAFNL